MQKNKLTKKAMIIWVTVLLSVSVILFIVFSIFNLYNLVALPLGGFICAVCVFGIYGANKEEEKRLSVEKTKKDTLAKAQKVVDDINQTVERLKQDEKVFSTARKFGSLDLKCFTCLCLTSFIYLGFARRIEIKETDFFSFVSNKEFVVKCLPNATAVTENDINDYTNDARVAYKYNDGRKYVLCSQGELAENVDKLAKNKRIIVFCGDSFAYCIRLAILKFNQYVENYAKAKETELKMINAELLPYLPVKSNCEKDDNWEEKLDILDDILCD